MPSANPIRSIVRSPTMIKVVGTTILTLILLIPLSSIESLILERCQRQEEVIEQLEQQWGPPLTIRGPLLVVPTRTTGQYQYRLPNELAVNGTIPVVERYRSIFRLPTYRGQLAFTGQFTVPRPRPHRTAEEKTPTEEPTGRANRKGRPVRTAQPAPTGTTPSTSLPEDTDDLVWERAAWVILLDNNGRAAVQGTLSRAGHEEPLQTIKDRFGIYQTFLYAPLGALPRDGRAKFVAKVDAFGSSTIDLAPLGENATVALRSDWPHPSFDGARLPTTRTVSTQGFRASWELNATLFGVVPSYLADTLPYPMAQSPTVTVRFVEAVSHYQHVLRGVKYALLVIVFTFVVFFLFEVLARLTIHPIQYLLVGCGLVLFYLLLLSLTEHISFVVAYGIAAGAVVLLISCYARAMLARAGRAAILGLSLGGVYGLLFVILREETLALLAGSWALFALLAALMFLTRRVDWSTLGRKPKAEPSSCQPVPPPQA